jgi:hypothetical protein
LGDFGDCHLGFLNYPQNSHNFLLTILCCGLFASYQRGRNFRRFDILKYKPRAYGPGSCRVLGLASWLSVQNPLKRWSCACRRGYFGKLAFSAKSAQALELRLPGGLFWQAGSNSKTPQ